MSLTIKEIVDLNKSDRAAQNAELGTLIATLEYDVANPIAQDGGPSWTSVFGVSGAAVVSADITTATAVTDAPTTGQKLVITDIIISSDTSMNILLEEETSGKDIFKFFIPGNGIVQITPRSKMKLATAGKKLTAKGSVTGNVGITICYYSEV